MEIENHLVSIICIQQMPVLHH